MKQAVIEFTGTLVVRPDGDEYEGGEMTPDEVRRWIATALLRGDKHEWRYDASGSAVSVEYEDYDPDE
ncbi:hypothetical protein ABZ446_28595 [Streptomyces sp. NPDC005813]|uniref:hypothetical protein n=1 Tax=Streptomyces sp. NPDC005813 TaxID=3155592 RepID=UPI0034006E77